MEHKINNALYTSDTSNESISIRLKELNDQNWNQRISTELAKNEGIVLSNKHLDVILYLRSYYLEFGLPRFARTTAKALNHHFANQGGSKYLHGLFNDGPVTQGSRLANITVPDNASDIAFGTSY
ncbi:MAG: TusE/DsrC/DsvC family sulfur relay protein [Gammaproteobacteria bacterium]|jgi:tRNA 2-thiouridine synthesizing protein E